MLKYIILRIISIFITLFIIITLTFFLMHSVPGGPYDYETMELNPEIYKALMEKYNLDDPILVQFGNYLKGIVTFDLGPSYFYQGRNVTELIVQGFPVTIRLSLLSLALVFFVSIPLGTLAAMKRNKLADRLVMFFATLGRTIPSFVMGTLLIYFISYKLKLLPIFGIGSWKHYILPSIALSMSSIGRLTRLNRATMLDVINQDYIRTAYAKGLNERTVIFKHALKNSSIPTVTVLGSRIATLLTGSFVIEQIFAMPGIGRYFVQSIGNRDYSTIMGITIYFSLILLICMLLVDIIYGFLDPRVRIQGKGSKK